MASSKTRTEQKCSEKGVTEAQHDQSQQGRFIFLATQVTLRVLAVAFTLASISVMVTSDQTVIIMEYYSQTASYSSSQAYRFLLIVNAVVSAFTLISLIFVYFLARLGSTNKNTLIMVLHVHDLVMVLLMMSGCAAASGVGYLGKYGQSEVGWVPVCGILKKYCHKILVSFVFAYLGLICYFVLTLLSAYNYKLMSMPIAAKERQ